MVRIEKRFANRVKCEIQPKRGGNNVDGKTVVASCDLERDAVVCYLCGVIYDDEQGEQDNYTPKNGKMNGVKVDGLYSFEHHERGMSIDPGKEYIAGLINHSCKPTCRLQWDAKKKITVIRTKKRLSKGDEITINYGRDWFENHDVECNCGCDPSKCYGYRYQEEDENDSDTEQETTLIKCAEEGKKIENNINRYSRDKELRNTVIEEQGCKCVVCGTCLEDIYGDIAENFIHVHHIVPLSRGKGRPKKVSADDLVPICPNCHAVLHHHFSYPNEESIEEMKHIVKVQRRKTK